MKFHHTVEALSTLDEQFIQYLHKQAPALAVQMHAYRDLQLSSAETSQWIIDTAPHLENFIVDLFSIQKEAAALKAETLEIEALFKDKKKNSRLFHPVEKRDYENLVPLNSIPDDPYQRLEGPCEKHREREGFTLTDPRMPLNEVMDEIDYCVYCHKNQGDFCSRGFPVKKNDPSLGFKTNSLGDVLTGCPLEEKISEMHVVKKAGWGIGALAIITIDNPMCAATGHRICNDCMKACIYQKQDPVNIPQVETRILTDVLGLPWGVEIYDLLIRWNPLRHTQFLPKPYNGKKILVMGMGPAGFTLAHHLLMEGCAVVGMDGLKIEPLSEDYLKKPIRDFSSMMESMDDRIMAGFGGVAEYGITVRWDKNFLKLIYLSLQRRAHFQVFGNARFGGTITVEKAWELGFDHLAITVGAGLPRELPIPNSLAKGMRQANDFLMALQLTGAAKKSSLANLQLRLPCIVIGGGLTGIDTATEAQAYYIRQVEKTHQRYHMLCAKQNVEDVRAQFDVESLIILDEFLSHAEKIIVERAKEKPKLNQLIRAWGGVTVVYRKRIQESPAYLRNHEEVNKALEEGIYYAENLEPTGVVVDEFGACAAMQFHHRTENTSVTLPAKSILVATGAKPNIAYEYEHRGSFVRVKDIYQSYDHEVPVEKIDHVKGNFGAFTSNPHVSFLGDTHPVFHGSVVKAIASAKRGYPKIIESLLAEGSHKAQSQEYETFRDTLSAEFSARVVEVIRHTKKIVELVVHAPLVAQQHHAGQFYRVQTYESSNTLTTETVPLLGVHSETNPAHLSFFVIENGASCKMLANLKSGDPIAVMGPTGAKTVIHGNQMPTDAPDVLVIGAEMALMYLLSSADDLKQAGHRIQFVGIIPEDNRFALSRVKKAAEVVNFVGNADQIVGSEITHHWKSSIRYVYTIGNSALLKFMQSIRSTHFSPDTKFSASVYGSMQCMLKGVCAQCLQWQIDPETGKRTKAVYACSWQHQPMEIIDIDNIHERLTQNRMQEILANLWFELT